MAGVDALELAQVSKVYEVGGTQLVALDSVDLAVADEEVVTLLGPSGSGKTTLLSIAGGLLSPSTGRVVVGGDDITHASARKLTKFRRKKVGFIFQGANLVPFLTARENLVIVSELSRRDSVRALRRAEELLERLGMSNRLNNLPGQLSGGERQRVAIGRALMNEPTLVLVDEPTSALDSQLGEQVMQLIVSEVKARGAAAVIVTHDQRMTRYGDRILTMADGRIASIQPQRPEWTRQPDLTVVEPDEVEPAATAGVELDAEVWPDGAVAGGQELFGPPSRWGMGNRRPSLQGRAGRGDASGPGLPQRQHREPGGEVPGERDRPAAAGGRRGSPAARAGEVARSRELDRRDGDRELGGGVPDRRALGRGPAGPGATGRSGPAVPTGRGGPAVPTGRGGPAVPTGRGGPAVPTGRRGPAVPTGRGGSAVPTGRGGSGAPTGRGGSGVPSGRGEPVVPTGRGGPAATRGRGGPAAPTGRGGSAVPGGRGGPRSGSRMRTTEVPRRAGRRPGAGLGAAASGMWGSLPPGERGPGSRGDGPVRSGAGSAPPEMPPEDDAGFGGEEHPGGRPRSPEDYVRRSLARARRTGRPQPTQAPAEDGWGAFSDPGIPSPEPDGRDLFDGPVGDPLDTGSVDTGRVDPVDVARAAIHGAREQARPPRAGSPEVRGSDSPRARRSGAGAAPSAWGASPPAGTPVAGSGGAGRPAAPLPRRRPGASAAERPGRREAPREPSRSAGPAGDLGGSIFDDVGETSPPAAGGPSGARPPSARPVGRAAWAPAPPGNVGSLPPAPQEGELRPAPGRGKKRRFGRR